MRSGTELSQFMRIFLPTLHCLLTGFFMKNCHLLEINEVYEHFKIIGITSCRKRFLTQ